MDVVSFKETTDKYSVIFLDAYGVLKSSTGLIEGALDVVQRLIAEGKEVFVVTNDSSRSPESMAERYNAQAGRELLPASRYISSGMLASEYLDNQVPYGKVAYLGKPESAHYVEIAGKIPDLLKLDPSKVVLDTWAKGKEFQRYADPEQYPPDETVLVKLTRHVVESSHEPRLEIPAPLLPVRRDRCRICHRGRRAVQRHLCDGARRRTGQLHAAVDRAHQRNR